MSITGDLDVGDPDVGDPNGGDHGEEQHCHYPFHLPAEVQEGHYKNISSKTQ